MIRTTYAISLMSELPNPHHKPLTVSGFLFGSLLTGAMICGVVGGLAVLFMAEGVIDVGPDPAIPAKEVEAQIARVDARIRQLEAAKQKAAAASAAPQEIATLRDDLRENAEQTEKLEKKVDTLSGGAQTENKAAQIALGLTQIKTAYDNDLPMTAGIETLKNAVTAENLKASLNELATVTSQGLPTKKELIGDIEAMRAALAPQQPDPSTLTWDQRAKLQLNKFVQVQPQTITLQQNLLNQTEYYIRNNDFTGALNTVKQFPQSAQQAMFYKKIEMRIRAEMMIHDIITGVTQKIRGGQGSLY